jgi:diadenosine tetraphosphate (Ap4A) HIT family hydrolase
VGGFAIDERLAGDTLPVGELDLSTLRLMKDRRFPWAVLVPRRTEIREIFDLTRSDRALLMEETAAVAEALARIAGADKMNVGALGNVVPQFHMHVIARRIGDAAWPGPVWGAGERVAYEGEEGLALATRLARALGLSRGANAL